MKKLKFPFTAILGQDNMKLALVLNVIDPKIGGVLLTGQQGTGKSTAVRSLVDILPEIEINEGCQFQCNLNDKENLCNYCKSGPPLHVKRKINLVNLPLGATEEMVIGSLDIEKIIREGKRTIQPGLLAKANQGILYVDEINLLQDHLVDILLDVSASGINLIEREGISLDHPSSFILVGSMNPEEGELRPQISDRLGLEVEIMAPTNPAMRAEISQRVIQFTDNPAAFCEKYQDQQLELSKKIQNAKKIINEVKISNRVFIFASELVVKLNLYSQRADLTFIRCARTCAALRGSKNVGDKDLEQALHLVFEHRLKRFNSEVDSEFLGNTFHELLSKIPEGFEDPNLYTPTEEDKPNTFKYSPDIQEKYHETPLNKKNEDIPEVSEGRNSKDKYSNANIDEDMTYGYKVSDQINIRRRKIEEFSSLTNYRSNTPLELDTTPILNLIKNKRQITNFTGRGSRVRILSHAGGHYIYARKPKGFPRSIAFDASIKSHSLNSATPFTQARQIQTSDSYSASSSIPYNKLAVQLKMDDIKEKIFELHAPLSVYFIVDASASMRRTLEKVIKVIQSIHADGYKKKDKVSIISFQGRRSEILQRPQVSLSVGIQKLRTLEATSYTPLASALLQTITMINQEKIKGISIPVVVIISDLGANISQKFPDLKAQTNEDFFIIEDELKEVAQKIIKRGIKLIVMKPQKTFATKYLGVNPSSVESIEESLLKASAVIFEADLYDSESTILKLNRVLGKKTDSVSS